MKERKDGDLVVFMSNGGFGGIHQKTLQALAMPHEPDRRGDGRAHRDGGIRASRWFSKRRIDPAVNARCVALAASLEQRARPGIRDVVPTYNAVTRPLRSAPGAIARGSVERADRARRDGLA